MRYQVSENKKGIVVPKIFFPPELPVYLEMPGNFQAGKRNLCDYIYVKSIIFFFFFFSESKCALVSPGDVIYITAVEKLWLHIYQWYIWAIFQKFLKDWNL